MLEVRTTIDISVSAKLTLMNQNGVVFVKILSPGVFIVSYLVKKMLKFTTSVLDTGTFTILLTIKMVNERLRVFPL